MKKILFLLVCILVLRDVATEKKSLFVGALFELSNHWYERYVNFFISIVEHVFDAVENRTNLLADYSLKLTTKDTEVCVMFSDIFFNQH